MGYPKPISRHSAAHIMHALRTPDRRGEHLGGRGAFAFPDERGAAMMSHHLLAADAAKERNATVFKHQSCKAKYNAFFCGAVSVAISSGLSGYYVDVGAAFGTEIAVVRAAAQVPAIGFECRVEEYMRVAEKFRADANATIIHACVSDDYGVATLYRASDSSSMIKGNVQRGPELTKARRENEKLELVPQITLDSVIFSMGVPAVGMIKIDTQGLEPAVLRGAAETIRRFRPLLFFECERRFGCHGGNQVLKAANLEGYRCECTTSGSLDCFCQDIQRVP